jgi:hypothetical protein
MLTGAITNRPKEYKKGPDVGSKSTRSKYHYKSLLKNQKTLEDLGFTKTLKLEASESDDDSEDSGKSDSSGFGEDTFEVQICFESATPPLLIYSMMN